MFGFGHTVRSVKNTLSEIIDRQESVVRFIDAEINQLETEEREEYQELLSLVRTTVLEADDERYAQLTAAAEKAGVGRNFTDLVASWRAEDTKNREERSSLHDKWGTRAHVAEEAGDAKEELEIVTSALTEVGNETTAFDEATVKIEAHNERYADKPQHHITEENHDDYEKWKLGRFLVWCVTFGNWAPHNAHRAIGDYDKEYGDYFEDAANIAKLRENQAQLGVRKGELSEEFNTLSGIGNRMDTLDKTFKGPGGIANGVRSIVKDIVLESAEFAQALGQEIGTEATHKIPVTVAKYAVFQQLQKALEDQKKEAKRTLSDLEEPMDLLERACWNVGNESIYFDMSSIDDAVSRTARISRSSVHKVQAAREAIDAYEAAPGTSYYEMKSEISKKADVDLKDNDLDVNMMGLVSAVQQEIREYERRRAEERRRAAEARRRRQEALQDTFDSISSHSKSGGGGLPGLDNVFGGSDGISRGNDDIFGGSGGISRGNDNIFGGNNGIKR